MTIASATRELCTGALSSLKAGQAVRRVGPEVEGPGVEAFQPVAESMIAAAKDFTPGRFAADAAGLGSRNLWVSDNALSVAHNAVDIGVPMAGQALFRDAALEATNAIRRGAEAEGDAVSLYRARAAHEAITGAKLFDLYKAQDFPKHKMDRLVTTLMNAEALLRHPGASSAEHAAANDLLRVAGALEVRVVPFNAAARIEHAAEQALTEMHASVIRRQSAA